MNYLAATTRAFLLVTLIVFVTCLVSAQDIDDTNFWSLVIARMTANVDSSNSSERSVDVEQTRRAAIQRIKDKPSFVQLVRESVRNDSRTRIRGIAAFLLVNAFEKHGASEDYVAILSDPDLEVRSIGLVGANAYGIQDVGGCFGVNLLSTNAVERWSAINGIKRLLGWKGLPYYVVLINDQDEDVAIEAAKAFRLCKKEDAVPHLLRFLNSFGISQPRDAVTTNVVATLYALFQETKSSNMDLKSEVVRWRFRCEKWVSKGPQANE